MSLPHTFALEFIYIDLHLILVKLKMTSGKIQGELDQNSGNGNNIKTRTLPWLRLTSKRKDKSSVSIPQQTQSHDLIKSFDICFYWKFQFLGTFWKVTTGLWAHQRGAKTVILTSSTCCVVNHLRGRRQWILTNVWRMKDGFSFSKGEKLVIVLNLLMRFCSEM